MRSILLFLLMLVSPTAMAQELIGQLQGEVTDAEGIAVPGVVVTITSPSMMGPRSKETNPEGGYRFVALPPGVYQLKAEKPGFNRVETDTRVSAGIAANVDITMMIAEAGAEIVVTATKTTTVDTSSVQTGVSVSKEMLRDIPNAGRDYQSAMTYAPGVVGSGNANMRGGVDATNQFFVDGVNTTDPLTNTFSMNMNLDAIEEVQVITGGMDAEYGRALGGVVNIVTRSGGNDFEGDVQVVYTDAALQIYKPLEDEDPDANTSTDQQVAANIGGPIQKDRLWFFTGIQANRYISSSSIPEEVGRPTDEAGFEVEPRNWRSLYLFGKLTWQPHSDHRLSLQGQTDPTDIQNTEQNAYTLPSGETYQKQGGWLGTLRHLWTPTATSVVENQVYASASTLSYGPMAWRDCENWDGRICEDDLEDGWFAWDPDGFSAGNHPYGYVTTRNRYSLNSSYTRFFEALGEHEVKVGLQAERMESWDIFPGIGGDGYAYYSHDGDPTNLDGYTPQQLYVYDTDLEAKLSASLVSVYLQDVWQVHRRLTIRPGIRLDSAWINNDVGEQVFQDHNLGPRLGVAYDVTGDNRTRIHAYYGRFYDPGYLEVGSTLLGQSQGVSWYDWNPTTEDWSTIPAGSSSSTFLAHDDLQSPYSDEVDLGVTRDLGDGWAVGANAVYKETHRRWEDDEVNLIWNADGTDVIGARNGTLEAIYRLRTPEEIFNEYSSLELTANRRFDEHWGMVSSYTWSRAYGYLQGNDAALASAAFDILPESNDEIGLQPYDRTHAVKVAGSYRDSEAWNVGDLGDLGFLFGWNFNLYSGYPYGRYEWNAYYGSAGNLKESIDGTYRMPAYSKLDLKTGLTLNHRITKVDLTLECFNVFNDRTVTAVNQTYEDDAGDVALDGDGELIWGTPLDRQSPRWFQLGLRGEF